MGPQLVVKVRECTTIYESDVGDSSRKIALLQHRNGNCVRWLLVQQASALELYVECEILVNRAGTVPVLLAIVTCKEKS
jgi:hypothetical protein